VHAGYFFSFKVLKCETRTVSPRGHLPPACTARFEHVLAGALLPIHIKLILLNKRCSVPLEITYTRNTIRDNYSTVETNLLDFIRILLRHYILQKV
jgi:hypothetical protein